MSNSEIRKQLQLIAQLSQLDQKIDSLYEKAGELPEKIEELERELHNQEKLIEELQEKRQKVIGEKAELHVEIKDIDSRRRKLEDLVFQVKNNRQYDAIMKELEYIKQQQQEAESKFATLTIQEENLRKQLEQEKAKFDEMKETLQRLEKELKRIEDSQKDEMEQLLIEREKLVKKIPKQILLHYERIREYHDDAAVPLKRGSCSGCYSVVPPQVEVELRNYYRVYFCENCGRVLYPEELQEEVPID